MRELILRSLLSLPCIVLCAHAFGQGSADAPRAALELGSGYAGVYPDVLDGRITASGARYDPDRMAAAHRTIPLGSVVRVVNVKNGRAVDVRIIDRGPFSGDRIMDLSEGAAAAIGLAEGDQTMVRIVPASSTGPSEDRPVRVAEYGAKTWAGTAGYTVQLGSFSSKEAADAVRARVEGAWILKIDLDGQTYFRLNFGRYGSPEDAAQDIVRLESEGFFGFVKSVADGNN